MSHSPPSGDSGDGIKALSYQEGNEDELASLDLDRQWDELDADCDAGGHTRDPRPAKRTRTLNQVSQGEWLRMTTNPT
jgi:hypothetical protein